MKPHIHIKNPLVRGGTSQKQRKFTALDPKYVQVDEQTQEDYIRFARSYSQLVQFYDGNNQMDGDWSSFFSEDVSESDPHFTLFLTFLRLLELAKTDINELTRKHLEFYYHDVLGLIKKKAKPDKTLVFFELAKNIETHRLAKGTKLSAGKDATGIELIYQTDEELVINKTNLAKAWSVFYDHKSGKLYKDIHDIAAKGDGSWKPFGDKFLPGKEEAEIELGFAVSSPLLVLAEGRRVVKIGISLSHRVLENVGNPGYDKDFLIYFSGEKDWIGPFAVDAEISPELNHFTLTIEIPRETEPIIRFNPDKLQGSFDHIQPVVKLLLNRASSHLTYDILRNSKVDVIDLEVEVDGIRNLVVQNDLTVLDPNKPFQPFGPSPTNGSNFYIGNSEIFQKAIEEVQICFGWLNAPEDIESHYQDYVPSVEDPEPALPPITAPDFKAEVELLHNKKWVPLNINQTGRTKNERSSGLELFAESKKDETTNEILSDFILTEDLLLDEHAAVEIDRSPGLEIGKQYSINSISGFMRLRLAGTKTDYFTAFGHEIFPRLYAERVIKKAGDGGDTIILPKEPYTPVMNSLSLNYKSSQKIQITNKEGTIIDNKDARYDRFYHIGPFGESEKEPLVVGGSDHYRTPLLDPFEVDGTFYLAFDNVKQDQSISILFQVEDGSADPALIGKVNLEWSYLCNNEWKPFSQKSILSDSTQLLIRPGIIKLKVPADITTGNTIMPADHYWIKAGVSLVENEVGSSESSVDGVGRLLSIHTQAVSATFLDNGNDPDHLKTSLPPKKINNLKPKDAAIKSVLQPFPSFAGKVAEQEGAFYTRVSERLRHKGRAITIWDYERLILEKFPSIYKVRSLNHTGKDSEFSPGSVTLIVVSNSRNQHVVNKLEPVTSISVLSDVISFLRPLISPFINLEVKNPAFEKIKLHFDVKFHEQYDDGFYLQQLEKDIQQFLSPWAFDEGQDLSFEGKIHRSVILNYVEERPYVDFVTCFKMDHVLNDEVYLDIDVAVATSSSAILVSAPTHDIQLIRDKNCSCEDRVEVLPEPDEGIGAMMVDFDFEVF